MVPWSQLIPPTTVQNQQFACFSNVESTAQTCSEGYGGAASWWSVCLAHVWPLGFNPCTIRTLGFNPCTAELWGSTPALQNLGWSTANSYLFAPDRRHWWLRTESILPSPAWVTQKQLHLRKVSSSVCDDSQGLHSWCPLDSLQAAPLKKVSFCWAIAVCVVYVPVCLCVWMDVCICVSVSICACVCASLCQCVCTHVCESVSVFVCVWVSESLCVCMCVCVYSRGEASCRCAFLALQLSLTSLALAALIKGQLVLGWNYMTKREKNPVKKTIHWGWRTSRRVRHKNMLKLPNKPSVLHPTRYHDCSFWEIAAFTLSPCNETQTPHGNAKWTANTQ